MIEKVLQDIGLTRNEIKVYISLLDLGESKTGDILKKSGLNSGKIYEILDSLQKKGMVSFITRSGVKYFSPANPKRVLEYIEEKKKGLIKQEEDFSKILPDLMKRISLVKTPSKIEIFTGIQGMKTAYSKELDFKKNECLYIQGLVASNIYPEEVSRFFMNIHQKRREKIGYRIKKILSKEARSDRKNHEKNSELRFLPYGSLVSVNVIGNLTTIGIFSESLIFISIENKELAESFLAHFNILWEVAKE